MGEFPAPELALVVVNYGSTDLLEANLAGLALPDAAVHVVDNWSTAANRDAVMELCDDRGWTGHYPQGNLGFGVGCNIAVDAALDQGASHILLLNPDATIDAPSIDALARVVRADPLCLAAPTICTPDGKVWSAGVDLDLRSGSMSSWAKRTGPPGPEVLPWVTGACLMISADLWRRVGGFDPDYFLYWEDVDLAARIRAVGGHAAVLEDARAVHAEGSTHTGAVGTRARSPIYYYYNVRNRMVFATKHLPSEGRTAWQRTSIAEAWRVLLRGGRRQFSRPHRNVWPALRGLIAGWRWASRRSTSVRGAATQSPVDN